MSENNTLLIVDDSRVSRMMISRLIQSKRPDWQLIEAQNGEEALDIAKASDIDYYSIDLNMPGIDGLEVISQLRHKLPASRMVLMTANIQDSVKETAIKLGASCVHKPVTEETVNQMLEFFDG
ncbi:MAG: response regulator [Betaproteobacteria bacterium]|nr:response regulator [Betaproteobacteria bacterium]